VDQMNPSSCAAQSISTLDITSRAVVFGSFGLPSPAAQSTRRYLSSFGVHLWCQIRRGCLTAFRIARMLTFDPRYPVISPCVRCRSHLLREKISSVHWCIQLCEQRLTRSPLSSKIYRWNVGRFDCETRKLPGRRSRNDYVSNNMPTL
jgi:hypothetical protein